MKDKKNTFLTWSDNLIFIIVCGVLASIILYYNKIFGVIAVMIVLYLIFYQYKLMESKEKQLVQKIEALNEDFDELTRNAVFNTPFAVCVVDQKLDIKWYNTLFKKLTCRESVLGENLVNFIPEFKDVELKENQKIISEIDGETYEFYVNGVEGIKGNEESLILMYGVNNSEDAAISKRYKDEGLVAILISIDNFDEYRNGIPEGKRTAAIAAIDSIVSKYALDNNGFSRKYETDMYLIVLEEQNLQSMETDRFKILDEVRELKFGGDISATLSIGVGKGEGSPNEIFDAAKIALDVALGRGGDQAVVKDQENLSYFGGKNRAQEKRNKVKARVISHALQQLIIQSSELFIMGHTNPDMDSFGSCLGILSAARHCGKRGYIVLNRVTPAIKNIYDRSLKEIPELTKYIINSEEAESMCTGSSLVVVLDNHRKNSTEAPGILDSGANIVLIDHHRRGSDYIKNAALTYLEPYASSTAELVTEILFYMEGKLDIPSAVADALLAGIAVDTKNFYYQTGVRTFEAAAILKRQGADSIGIKSLFKDEFSITKHKAEIIVNSVIDDNGIAIGRFSRDVESSALIAAQAADELLNVHGVDASFVLTLKEGKVHISGRSLGSISVQLILEKIGGGGHLTAAATQLDMTMDRAYEKLQQAIQEYFNEEALNESNTNK